MDGKFLIAIFLISFFVSVEGCMGPDADQSQILSTVQPEINTVLIIPQQGCTGCIGQATQYVLAHATSMSNSKVIYTNILDRKGLKILLDSLYLSPAIMIDSTNRFYDPQSANANYPMLWKRVNEGWKGNVFSLVDTIYL